MSESVLAGDDAAVASEPSAPAPPVATEAPASLSPAPSTEGQPDAPPSGTQRDEHGRFAKRDGETPAALGEERPPAAPGQPPRDAQIPAIEPQPFHFRSNGTRVPIQGATYEPGKGLHIPETQVATVRQLLARGHEYHTVGQARESQYRAAIQQLQRDAQARTQQDDAELEVYKAWFMEILADESGDTLVSRADNFKQEAALLKSSAERAKLAKQLEAMQAETAAPQASEADQQRQLVQMITASAADYLEDLKEDGRFAALTPADWKDLAELVREQPGALLDTSQGEYRLDTQPLRKAAERFKRVRTEAAEQGKALSKAATYNAQRATPSAPTGTPKPAPRATVPATDDPDEKYRRAEQWKREVGIS